jgi:hypothetical protein
LFELTDAALCTEGPVRSLVGLSLAPEHRRGHGALYDGINHGDIDIARLRNLVATQQLPRAADGRIRISIIPRFRPSLIARLSRRVDASGDSSHLLETSGAAGRAERITARPCVGRPFRRDVGRSVV